MKKIVSVLFFICTLFLGTAYADKIAIIGGGASGLVTAWLLEQDHDVSLYEADNHLGGHASSISVKTSDSTVMVDTGTEFFNEYAYPHFLKLLRYYHVPLKTFSMVTMFYRTDRNDVIMLPPTHDGLIEWKSFSAQNLLRSIQVKGVLDEGHKIISVRNTATTLRELVDTLKYGQNFKDGFFYPYLASNWGVSPEEIQDFSAYDVLKYMVDGYDSKTYDWYEVEGGLQKYIDIVSGSLRTTKIKLNSRVTQVSQTNNHYAVLDVNGTQQEYDHVIFTTDASVTSALLSHLPLETQLAESLAKVKYYTTKIAIHSDKRFMPPDANDWRVINIRYDGSHAATTVYKSWKSKTPIFKSWITYDVRAPNDKGVAMPSNLYGLFTFNHPIVDHHYFEAQKVVEQLQGNHNLWFAGMWTYNNDSHESAVISAIKIAERLAPNSDRLNILKK